MTRYAKIVGTGSYLPKKILSNQDLEKMIDTSNEWIVSRTGMKERRIAGDNESSSDMGYLAALDALKNSPIEAKDLDLIIVPTITPDYPFPSTSCLIQHKLNAPHAATIDIQAACSGFIYALSMAQAYIQSGIYKNILIIATEKLSSIVDYNDRNTCVLFGDGAGSCVVSESGNGFRIEHSSIGGDGSQSHLLKIPAGGSKNPTSADTLKSNAHFLKMEGKELFKHAVRRMEEAVNDCLHTLNLTESDVSWMIPHQANLRIIDALAKRFNIPKDHVYITIHKYANTSSSSIPIALNDLSKEGLVKPGEKIVLAGFGAGLTWGASVITYEGNNV